MSKSDKSDLDEIVSGNDPGQPLEQVGRTEKPETSTEDLSKITDTEAKGTIGKIVANTYNYLTEPKRLKALAVLGFTVAGVAILKDQLPEITDYFRETFPSLSKEAVSLAVDTTTNTILAPIGFLLSNYAHNQKLNRKEFAGQVAFAAAWGVLRHYVYSGLANFDEVTPVNVSLKTGLYIVYYAAYGGLYAAFSEYWHKVCNGIPHLDAIRDVGKNFGKKLKAIAKDSNIQLNLALNILNMFNPWVESRPTVAGGLLIDYNMGVIKHSHERKHGFLSYLRSVFVGGTHDYKKPTPS